MGTICCWIYRGKTVVQNAILRTRHAKKRAHSGAAREHAIERKRSVQQEQCGSRSLLCLNVLVPKIWKKADILCVDMLPRWTTYAKIAASFAAPQPDSCPKPARFSCEPHYRLPPTCRKSFMGFMTKIQRSTNWINRLLMPSMGKSLVKKLWPL